jgi:hypothetical protein
MSDSDHNQIRPITNGEILTNGLSHTIEGAGNLLSNRGGLVNLGIITATGTNHPLVIDPDDQGFVTHGPLEAAGASGIDLRAGSFTNSGSVFVAETSRLDRTGDYVQNAGRTMVNGVLAASGQTQILGGTLGGIGTVSGVSNSGGEVMPGTSAGRLTMAGDFAQSNGGTLVIEIGGTAAGTEHDQLAVTGDARLGGELRVSLIDGFAPEVGDQFTVLTAGGMVSGTFVQGDQVQVGDRGFRVEYTARAVTLTYTGTGDTFDSWRIVHFPDALDQPEISGADADPDQDGLPNLLEFAGGSDPNDPADRPLLKAGFAGEYFALEFLRDQSALGVTINVEASVRVTPWNADPDLLQLPPEVVDHGDGTETLRFLAAQPVSARPGLFLRLVAAEQP